MTSADKKAAATTAEVVAASPSASPPAPTTPAAMDQLLALAVDKNIGPDGLEKLVALQERITDRLAAQEFTSDLAAFQGECPPIAKTSTAVITQRSGARYSYTYADLATIADTVRPLLHKHGFSYSWDSVTTESQIDCVCKLAHASGHTVEARFSCPLDAAAKMNPAQRAAAALTYAKRQSLVQVLGITTAEPDTDAASDEGCTPAQIARIEELIQASGANRARFEEYIGYPVADIPARDFSVAVSALEAKLVKATRDAKPGASNPNPGTPEQFFDEADRLGGSA